MEQQPRNRSRYFIILAILSIVIPCFTSLIDKAPLAEARRPQGGGSASGNGFIYPYENDATLGLYFNFRIQSRSAGDIPKGKFELRLMDLDYYLPIFALENVTISDIVFGLEAGYSYATITGTADVADYSFGGQISSPADFTVVALDDTSGGSFNITIGTMDFEDSWEEFDFKVDVKLR